MEFDERLKAISEQIDEHIKPPFVTARDFIWWFGAQRRSPGNVEWIREELKKFELITDPDFEYVYIDSEITFKRTTKRSKQIDTESLQDIMNDPTYRIGKLASANNHPVSVKPDDTIVAAATIMIANDYSQLPVMTSERTVNGIITWKSIASFLSLNNSCEYVRECMEPHKEISYETYIFSAIEDIISNEYALVRDSNKIICGIVTTSDLSQQFRSLGEPYLLLGEIENYIRRMLHDKFSLLELKDACFSTDDNREVHRISDLTLGEYTRLIENPDNWDKLNVNIDRKYFVEKLHRIRSIRNDVMHFDPDGMSEENLEEIRDFVRLLQSLAKYGAI